jgi:conjugal transfer pilus assembly protein TraU
MNGTKIGSGRGQGGFHKSREASDHRTTSFYHIHYYIYPLIYWLNLITDFGCLEAGSYDIAYFSELDPSHNKDNIANILNPETFLFANPVAVAACSADCVKANMSFPSNSLFWCAGCLGSIYPFSGNISGHVGGVQASSLLAVRTLAKLHRTGLAKRTSTSDGSINGPLCETNFAPKIIKDQYKLQMTYPIPASKGAFSCNPLGMADALYNSGKEFPYKGEDFSYLVWRKRNCCFL